jgi:hypothetical protein
VRAFLHGEAEGNKRRTGSFRTVTFLVDIIRSGETLGEIITEGKPRTGSRVIVASTGNQPHIAPDILLSRSSIILAIIM